MHATQNTMQIAAASLRLQRRKEAKKFLLTILHAAWWDQTQTRPLLAEKNLPFCAEFLPQKEGDERLQTNFFFLLESFIQIPLDSLSLSLANNLLSYCDHQCNALHYEKSKFK
jgi:hypothetical protein